jgi:hypothetical protein
VSVWLCLYGSEFVVATQWLHGSGSKSMVASLWLLVYGECVVVWLRVHGCECVFVPLWL